jgi:acyl-CoA synthetase (AMP-forming)/AMP-acid ligase II
MMNAATVIQNGVEKNPDKVAIIFEDRKITYGELDKRINRVANGLLLSLFSFLVCPS